MKCTVHPCFSSAFAVLDPTAAIRHERTSSFCTCLKKQSTPLALVKKIHSYIDRVAAVWKKCVLRQLIVNNGVIMGTAPRFLSLLADSASPLFLRVMSVRLCFQGRTIISVAPVLPPQ